MLDFLVKVYDKPFPLLLYISFPDYKSRRYHLSFHILLLHFSVRYFLVNTCVTPDLEVFFGRQHVLG